MSLFLYSVNGGCTTVRFAINHATGHIVPMDDNLDISHHKRGWHYSYKYLGRYAFYPNMDIIDLDDDGESFRLGRDEYCFEEDGGWTAKCLVKTARLLFAFGAPETAMLSLQVKTKGERTAEGCFSVPLLARCTPEPTAVRSLLQVKTNDEDILDNDPFIARLRRNYARVISAPLGLPSPAARFFLADARALADRFNIKGTAVTKAFEKASVTEHLSDIEIFKELVHSGLRKTPLFGAVYGCQASPEHVFVAKGSMAGQPV